MLKELTHILHFLMKLIFFENDGNSKTVFAFFESKLKPFFLHFIEENETIFAFSLKILFFFSIFGKNWNFFA